VAAGLRLWGLDQNGFGNEYYAAAVRSMALSAHNFFYAAFDPAGFISVDKPPVALWMQVASTKLLGFSGWPCCCRRCWRAWPRSGSSSTSCAGASATLPVCSPRCYSR
jgi:hypothetical protein